MYSYGDYESQISSCRTLANSPDMYQPCVSPPDDRREGANPCYTGFSHPGFRWCAGAIGTAREVGAVAGDDLADADGFSFVLPNGTDKFCPKYGI